MRLNPPRRARVLAYIFTTVGTPVVAYLRAKGYIGDLELGLWAAEVTAVSGLAAFNTTGE